MMSTQAPLQLDARTMSFEEYLEAYDGVHAEWVDGRVLVMSPGNRSQSRLTRFLSAVLQHWAEAHDLGEVFVPPFALRLGNGVAREPDVFFLGGDRAGQVHGTSVQAPADLVIEILSPSSRGTDRGDKFYEYEEAGISDYWLIDPEREVVEAYRLTGRGQYERRDLGVPMVLTSDALPGLRLPVEWLWREPLPKLSWVIQEWGLI
jgi:Uma2 family endonuclease